MNLRVRRRRRYRLHPRWRSVEEMIEYYGGPDGSLAVDLGSGYYAPEGFIGVDDMTGMEAQLPREANAPDLYTNLDTEPLPLPEGSCREVRASHFLEHSKLDVIFDEVFRLLRPGGTFHFAVPYANSPEGMFPGHLLFMTERFFHENLHFQRLFEIEREQFDPSPLWDDVPAAVKEQLPFDLARQVLFGVCNQMKIWATKKG
ncbi:MAG TPA: methyltransferase domain-containing protein [Solirubrobacteraceae bacterium]